MDVIVALFVIVGLFCFSIVLCVHRFFVGKRYRYLFLLFVLLIGLFVSSFMSVATVVRDISIPHQPAPLPNIVQLLVQDDTGLSSIRGSDGSQLWHYNVNDVYITSYQYAVSGDTIYIAIGTDHGANYFVSLRANSGKQLWKISLPSGITYGVSAPLLISNGIAYVPTGNSSDGERLLALHTNNGMLAWQTSLNDLTYDKTDFPSRFIGNSQPSPFVTSGGLLFMTTADGTMHALRAQDGTQAWGVPVGKDMLISTLANGQIYLTDGYTALALRTQDGTVLWRFQLVDASSFVPTPFHPLTVASGHVYAITDENTINALSAQDGKLLWQHTIANTENPAPYADLGQSYSYVDQEPYEAGGIVYVSLPDVLVALSPHNGKELWRYEMQHTDADDIAAHLIGEIHHVVFIYTTVTGTGKDFMNPFAPICLTCSPEGITALNTTNGSPYWHVESEFYGGLMVSST